MKLSVVIPTLNRAEILRKCLQSLTMQTLSVTDFEVIVVDNGSSDGTKQVATAFDCSLQLVYCYKEESGLHVGRHEGLKLSRSNILVFADDDIQATPTWLEAIYTNFKDVSVAMVGGNNYPAFEHTPPDWLSKLWARTVDNGQLLGSLSILDFGVGSFEIDPRNIWGCNFAIRRDVLLEAGGFHPDAFPKEKLHFRGDGETHVSNFVRDSNKKAMFDSKASVYHLVSKQRMTKEYFCQRYYAQGISDSYSLIRSLRKPPDYNVRIKRLLRVIKAKLKHFKTVINRQAPVDIELSKVLSEAQCSQWRGFEYHIRRVQNDPALLAWVIQSIYYDKNIIN